LYRSMSSLSTDLRQNLRMRLERSPLMDAPPRRAPTAPTIPARPSQATSGGTSPTRLC
jgi:hypothetical protein